MAKMKKWPLLAHCFRCGKCADIGHILISCPYTKFFHSIITGALNLQLEEKYWILGSSKAMNPVIWLFNFAIYKTHLLVIEGHDLSTGEIFRDTLAQYGHLFSSSLTAILIADSTLLQALL